MAEIFYALIRDNEGMPEMGIERTVSVVGIFTLPEGAKDALADEGIPDAAWTLDEKKRTWQCWSGHDLYLIAECKVNEPRH